MSYKRADEILPLNLIKAIQKYVDGESIYIPRKEGHRCSWGDNTNIKEELKLRNKTIFNEYLGGAGITSLSKKYFLSEKSIQRIIRNLK